MLSIENIADPSCSCRAPPLKADERASGQLPPQEADPVGLVQSQTSNFSIRDYAFASRSKDIETNWPFPHKFLQLCLKHGIKELLPPFEPPDLVRSRCSGKAVDLEAEHIVAQVRSRGIEDVVSNGVDPTSCLPSDELVLEAQYPSQKEEKQIVDEVLDDKLTAGDAEIPSTLTSHDQIEGISSLISGVEFDRQPPRPKKLEISQELPGKKCKLVLKLSGSSQSRRTEDIASTSSTISDPMASKVCPVCKLFSSTSNTTLNAHMDQCLFMESNTTLEETKTSNLRVKPRKKRLMVDIYATAPYCTLEDLDRRNGTTWARDLALVAPAVEAPTEIKKPRLSQVDTRHDGGDEPVYVDSNGIKLRILSKFSDMPPVMPQEESKLSKPGKEINEGKGVLSMKNKQFASKYLKHIKTKQLSKKLSSFEMPRGENQASPASEYHAETRREKEEAHSAVVARDHSRSNGSATLRQWVCSKRSDLPKKMKKTIHQCSENPEIMTKSPLLQSDQPDLRAPSVVRSQSLDPSQSTKDLTSSPRTKNADILQTAINEKKEPSNLHVLKAKWSSGSTLSNGLRLKLSRSCVASSSSTRNTREGYLSKTQKSDDADLPTARPLESCQPLMKAKKIVSLKKNILVRRTSFPLETGSSDAVEKSPKMFRKKRSRLVTSKRGGELTSDSNGTPKKVRTLRSNFSMSILSSRAKEYVAQMSPGGNDTQESENEREESPMEELKCVTPEQEPSDTECYDIMFTSKSKDKADDGHVRCDTIISDHLVADSINDVDPKPSGGKYAQNLSGNETNEEPTAPRLVDKQVMESFDVTRQEIAFPTSIQVADEVEVRGEGDYQAVQCRESQAETVSAQESSACLTSHGDQVPPENSSATSGEIKSNQNQSLIGNRESSLSPGSTASTISTPPRKVSQSKFSEDELSRRLESSGGAQGREIEIRNEEAEMVSLAKEPEQLSDSQHCCCSRREGLLGEFPFPRQSSVPRATVPSKGKQISNLYIAPRLSSFVSYPSVRTESPTGSNFTKLSPDSTMRLSAGLGASGTSSMPQTPSTPNSVLRLMGKNLMVLKEEPPQLSNTQPAPSQNPFPSLGFVPARTVSNQESFWYHSGYQPPTGPSVFCQAPPVGNHQFPLHSGVIMKSDHPGHPKNLNKRPSSPMTSPHLQHQKLAVASSRTPYSMKEVIVIDDSPDTEPEKQSTMPIIAAPNPMAQQRPFLCFPSHGQYISRDVSGGFRPLYPKPCPRELANNPLKSSEGLRPLLPSPLFFQSSSTGHLGQPLYYP